MHACTFALIVLLVAERQLVGSGVGGLVRRQKGIVRRWLARYRAEGVSGWQTPRTPSVAKDHA